jgi:predicted regulator of Ras-like GTPase activity (Roadblock/LC7/MglB family)
MIATLETTPAQKQHLDFLLNDFCAQVPGVSHAIAVSGDGIPLSASKQVGADVRDQLAAAASGLMSLGAGVANLMQAGVPNHIAVNLDAGWVFVQRPTQRLVLVVLASLDTDLGQVDHELLRLGESIGQVLEPAPRAYS